MDFGGHRVDRFYHVIVPVRRAHDRAGRRARPRRRSCSFSPGRRRLLRRRRDAPVQRRSATSPRFPPLSPLARLRLGVVRRPVPAAPGLRAAREHPARAAGCAATAAREVVERIWTPAARLALRRPTTTSCPPPTCGRAPIACAARAPRSGGGETMGCLRGGHERLIDAAAARARELRRRRSASAPASRRSRSTRTGAVTGVDGRRRGRALRPDDPDPAAAGAPAPAAGRAAGHLLDAYPQRYLGRRLPRSSRCARSLLPYYSVNICEPTPITTVVETSHVVGTEHTDGLRLVYLPKYCEAVGAGVQRGRRVDLRAASPAMLARAGARLPPRRRRRLDRAARAARRAGARARHDRASRRSGRASPASRWPPPARSTRACSTATPSCGWPRRRRARWLLGSALARTFPPLPRCCPHRRRSKRASWR